MHFLVDGNSDLAPGVVAGVEGEFDLLYGAREDVQIGECLLKP